MSLNVSIKVHPVVLFQIVDSYERRNVDCHRVIGTLLGSLDKGVVEVTNCFCVPHKEHDEMVEAELNYAKAMFEMNQKVNASEIIVGWWATGDEVTSQSSVIHDYYLRENKNSVHMTLDTNLKGTSMGIKGYVHVPIGVPGGKSGIMFTQIPAEVLCYDSEITGLRLLNKSIKHGPVQPLSELTLVSEAADKLSVLIENVLRYVDEVLANRIQPDNSIGRQLLEMVNSVPSMTQEQFESMFNSNIKDLLMIIALSQLTRTQLLLNEKLTLLTSF